MRKKIFVVFTIAVICLQISWQRTSKTNPVNIKVRTWLVEELTKSKQQLVLSILAIDKPTRLKQYYFIARKHYKHTEFFVEYYSPKEAKYFINGPLVLKHDIDFGSQMIQPQGFQRIEELLFASKTTDSNTILLKNEYQLLIEQLNSLITYYQTIEVLDGQYLEMFQLQLFRFASLNLNGYDATITHNNIEEIIWSIQGIENTLKNFSFYTSNDKKSQLLQRKLLKELDESKTFLNKNKDYNTFPRLEFITKYINPINRSLVDFHNECNLEWDTRKQAIDLKEYFLFGKESFNQRYFSIYYDDTLHLKEQSKLGELLFYDNILSKNNNRSCGSCHNPSLAFSDGLARSITLEGDENKLRNAPGLLNVIYQKAFFYDGKAYQLEQQIFDVVHNKNEMGGDLNEIVNKLQQHSKYNQLFKKAFIGSTDTIITTYAIQKAITEYEKTLTSFNSKFDNYLRGDISSLNTREVNGYNLFAGKALCGSCHFFPLFNGTVPPFFNDSEFEAIGVPKKNDNKNLDDDKGRYAVTGIKEQLYYFKTPGIRNIELTAPYMHNGIYETLDEVMDFYHHGGGKGFGFDIQNQTLPFDSLELNKTEEQDIILFLKSLTDTTNARQRHL